MPNLKISTKSGASDSGRLAFQLMLAATHVGHVHRQVPAAATGSRRQHKRLCAKSVPAAATSCPSTPSQSIAKQDKADRRRSRRLAAKPEAAQAGSTDAGSAVANGAQETAAGHQDLLELMEEIKQKTHGIALLARDCPPENVNSALEERVAQEPAELRQTAESNDGPFICAPEDFQLEPGAVSHVSQSSNSPLDIFRCSGCTRSECQGSEGCADMQWRRDSDGYLKKVLTANVYDVAVSSNLEVAERLSEQLGNTLLLKREDMQPVFSFKLRGAFNKMKNLSEEQRALGVVCSSAGNHAQGVALAAARLGCEALVCMPETTPEIKVKAVKRLGGTVELVGESYTETQAYAQELARREGKVFVAPYDDPYTIAGQGTIGKEIMEQLPTSSGNLHAIFVPVGGGGLIAGVAAYVRALFPAVRVIGVEPSGANCMAASLARGERVTLSAVDAFADGVAVKTIGAETFRLSQQLVDGIVLVDNAAVSGAVQDVFEETRSILEPAGALAVAGARAYLKHHNLKGKTVVAITSGANINFHRLRLVSELADVGASKEAILAVTLDETQGQFRELIDSTVGETLMQITELKYRYSAGPKAHVLMSVAIRSPQDLAALMERLSAGGFNPLDLSSIQEAQVHLRHLVGGRSRSFMGQLPDERIMTVDFPERPGALRAFLLLTSPRWNISLFHYRKSGIQTSQVLLGIQVPASDEAEFQEAIAQLPEGFTIGYLSSAAQQAFSMFIT